MDSSLHEIQADLQRLSFDNNPPMGGPMHQTPTMQSFASLNQAPTYNNIKYINNVPQPNHQVIQRSFMFSYYKLNFDLLTLEKNRRLLSK